MPSLARLATRVPAPVVRFAQRNALLSRIGRRLFSRPLRGRDVVVRHGPAAGLRINIGASNLGYALGTEEPVVQEALVSLLRPGSVFWDVGANVGFLSLLAARLVGPAGAVVAFEPLPALAAVLERNAVLNGFEHVRVRRAAVAERVGSAEMSVGANETTARLGEGGPTVELTTLDEELRRGLPPPTLVKIDVEGAEVAVLDGMTGVLREVRPLVLAEMHGRNRQVAERLRAAGYALRTLDAEGPLEEAPWWAHVLATPPEAAESS